MVIATAIAGLHMNISSMKPFNPILGETYEGYFDDGTMIHCEHTSHHPPITNFYLIGKGFKFYGRYEYFGKISGNTLILCSEG